MTSSNVSDLAAPIATLSSAAPALPEQKTKAAEPFGAVLEEATASNQQSGSAKKPSHADGDKVESDGDESSSADKEKKKSDVATDATALICVCPPPNLPLPDPVKPAKGSSSTTSDDQQVIGADASAAQTGAAATATATNVPSEVPLMAPDSQEAVAQTVVNMVQPKTSADANAPKPSRGTKSSGAIELDRKLFEPVLPEAVSMADLAKTSPSKAAPPQPPPVANATHGTLVAQLENHVKNTEKSAEIAPGIEQKMPVREVLRRAMDELMRVESFHADKQGSHLLIPDFEAAPAETVSVKSLDAAHLIESIRTEVASLQQRGDNTVTVVLRPDSGTQLSVDISVARDGSVHAIARCERGDFQSLQTQWPQLQESLAAHGIRVADLSNQNNAQQQNHRSAGAFQNFDRGENNSKQRDQRELPSFEEQFSASKTKFSVNKTQPQLARTASATRRWQSWA